MKLKIYLWIMGWSGKINAWAWRKQAAIVREKNRKEEEDYLKELKKKIMKPDEDSLGRFLESHYHWCIENGRDVSWYKKIKEKEMTATYGLGMFGYNMICLAIGLII